MAVVSLSGAVSATSYTFVLKMCHGHKICFMRSQVCGFGRKLGKEDPESKKFVIFVLFFYIKGSLSEHFDIQQVRYKQISLNVYKYVFYMS